jgi:preprotein translocase subunit SecB
MSETAPVQPLVLNIQYTKDLSFEVPNAPSIYTILRSAPLVNINLDVQVRRIQEDQMVFEVILAARAEATLQNAEGAANGAAEKPMVVFIADLSYAGIFARNILADITRDGGFPPVMLAPVDFVSLWQSRRAQLTTPPANA